MLIVYIRHMPIQPAQLIFTARSLAQLTQQELAELANTTQPAIAIYESGSKSPGIATLERILLAAGFDLNVQLTPHGRKAERLLGLVEAS